MSTSQRRQMMQPWPLCLVPFSRTKERTVLPKHYTRVPSVARSSTTSSGITLDCSSNATLVTNASPFNSQTALIAEKKVLPTRIIVDGDSANHYYAQNLRNNHRTSLTGPRIYDPLDKDLDHDYKQLDPLLAGEIPCRGVPCKSKPSMSCTTQDAKKAPKDSGAAVDKHRGTCQFQKEAEPSVMRFASQRGSYNVIMSNDSPPPLQTSIPLVDYDIPDEAHLGKITSTTPTTPVTSKLLNADTDTETIENAVVIARTVLPVPEQQPKIEKNGIDSETKKPVSQPENDSCVVDCIYFTQQCCECVIF